MANRVPFKARARRNYGRYVLFFRSCFSHRPIFLNDRKKLSQIGQNVWKYILVNTVTASFNTTVKQRTETSQQKNLVHMLGHNSPADKSRELFKPTKDSESFDLRKWEVLGLNMFWRDVTTHNRGTSGIFTMTPAESEKKVQS